MAIDMKVDDQSKELVKNAKIYGKSIQAYNYMCLGDINEGITVANDLFDDPDVPDHPTFGIIISTLAWSNFLKGRKKQALELYELSFRKLKENHLEKNRWIVPMCYIADLYSDIRNDHENGLKLICQAENIQTEFCMKHVNFARISMIKGKINVRMGQIETAIQCLNNAAGVLKVLDSSHHIFVEISIWLAHCSLINGYRRLAKERFIEIDGKLNTEYRPPTQCSYNTAIKKHLQELDSVQHKPDFYVYNCEICRNIITHTSCTASSSPEIQHSLKSRMSSIRREPVESESPEVLHYPQPETGCG